MPRFSILTPCLNRKPFLERAIRSALSQGGDDWEHIVADGGSTDGSVELLVSFRHLQVLSGPDRNLYDALNKALSSARGEWVVFLNTDDILLPGALAALRAAADAHPDADSICGRATFEMEDSAGHAETVHLKDRQFVEATIGIPAINARIFKRKILNELSGFDCTYALAADRDLLIRFLQAGHETVTIDRPIYRYCIHSGSLTLNPNAERRLDIAREHRRLARTWLHRDDTPPELRNAVRQWHAWETGVASQLMIRTGQLRASAQLLVQGFSEQPTWPLVLAGMALRRIKTGSHIPE